MSNTIPHLTPQEMRKPFYRPWNTSEIIKEALSLFTKVWFVIPVFIVASLLYIGIIYILTEFGYQASFTLNSEDIMNYVGVNPQTQEELDQFFADYVDYLIKMVTAAVVEGILEGMVFVLPNALMIAILGTIIKRTVTDETIDQESSLKARFTTGLTKVKKLAIPLLLTGFLYHLATLVGLFLLLLPGLYLMIIWSVIIPVVIEEDKMSVKSIFSRSKELSKGKIWKIAGVLLLMYIIQTIAIFFLSVTVDIVIAYDYMDDSFENLFLGFVTTSVVRAIFIPLMTIAAFVLYFDLKFRSENEIQPSGQVQYLRGGSAPQQYYPQSPRGRTIQQPAYPNQVPPQTPYQATVPSAGGTVCPSCNTKNPPIAAFCVMCGTQLPKTGQASSTATPSVNTNKKCLQCGKPAVIETDKFCQYCGKPYEQKEE